MNSPDGNHLWCPDKSLWRLIAEHVSASELQEIHTALGHSLVDTYIEVHSEVEIWHKMCQMSQRGGNHGRGAGTTFTCPQGSPLADPPVVKELLRAEVKMLLQNLRERASRRGRDGEELLSRYKPETVNYALSHLDSCYRKCTNPKVAENGSRPSSHCSVQSSAEDEIEAMRDKLNVTEITQVVDRLRSVMMEECEALTRLLKYLKGNIKQKLQSRCEFDRAEPSLAELRELRGAVQMDLELFPSSLAASPSLPVRELKSSYRLSAGRGPETPPALTPTPILRPHSPLPLCHPQPRPPAGPPLTKSSMSRTHGQHRLTSASNKSNKTPPCNNISTSGHTNDPFKTDHITVQSEYSCSLSPEQDSTGLHHRTPTSSASFQIKSEKNSLFSKTHLSSHGSIHTPSTECDVSSQRERKSSTVWRSRSINITPSPVPALSQLCDTDSFSSNKTSHSVSTMKSRTPNGQQNSSRGGFSRSSKVQIDNHRGKNTSEIRNPPAQNGRRKNSSEMDNNKNAHLRRDVNKKQSLSGRSLMDSSSRHPECSDTLGQAVCTQSASARVNGQSFTSPKKPHEGTTSQPKSVQDAQTLPQFLNRFYQPVPPARVPT
ncbi:coiled-coil domain-containing protein 24 isoform X1 [Amphiprion ocellaris]|uniref:Coiled-coil domain-containing protein 24 n=1 Tax=Amphiprion ocellaris TaxID=80972 RepID=A0A3Q1BE04_AMPOC|nr:coiled-coil domain-containing protein 24 isoform X1 [Amphiprion ocellaris]